MRPDRPSETAMRIAGSRIAAAKDPALRKLLLHPDEPYSRWFVEAHSARAKLLTSFWSFGPTRSILNNLSERVMPGGPLYILLRKRYVEETAREIVKRGVHQVVVFGAGYDPLSIVLAIENPTVGFYEIDHPATQEIKRKALEQQQRKPRRLILMPLDLGSEEAEERLQTLPGFWREGKTLFIAEGLIMYLDPEAVDTLFSRVCDLASPGSTFVFSAVDADALEDPESALSRSARILAQVGEPIRSALRRSELPVFLKRRGFELKSVVDAVELKRRYCGPLGIDCPVLEGELLVTAERI